MNNFLINTSIQLKDNIQQLCEGFYKAVEIESVIIIKSIELDPWANHRLPIRPIQGFTVVYIVFFEVCNLTS